MRCEPGRVSGRSLRALEDSGRSRGPARIAFSTDSRPQRIGNGELESGDDRTGGQVVAGAERPRRVAGLVHHGRRLDRVDDPNYLRPRGEVLAGLALEFGAGVVLAADFD